MPTSVGPNTKGEENLVFGYDLGDIDNSYKGEPATNLITSGLPGYFGSGGETLYQERLYGLKSDSGVFQRNYVTNPATSDTSTFNNNGGLYKTFTTSTLNSATRYVQITFDFYLVTRYRTFGSSTRGLNGYLGITNTDSTTDIYFWDTRYSNGSGDDWSNVAAYEGRWQKVSLIAALRGDKNPASINAMYIYYDRFTQGEGIFTNFMMTETTTLPTGPVRYTAGTRSATQGLIDITGNSTIDLTNVSFDSNAQMTFDGSSDYINFPAGTMPNFGTDDFAIEVVFKMTKSTSYSHFYQVKDQYYFALKMSNGDQRIYVYRTSALSTYSSIPADTTLGAWHHLVCQRNGDNIEMYLNGEYKGSKSGWGSIDIDGDTYDTIIGKYNNEYSQGKQAITKVYNRALTASEVKANFNAVKSRFGI